MKMARKIVTANHETKMLEILSILNEKLHPGTTESIEKIINDNKNFQTSFKFQTKQKFAEELQEGEEHNWRLPKNSIPIRYDLNLKSTIHTSSLVVDGVVNIRVKIIEKTDKLTLHARNLNIDQILLFNADSRAEIGVVRFSLYAPTDMLTIYLTEEIEADKELFIMVDYNFEMNNQADMTGFYRTSYFDDNNVRR